MHLREGPVSDLAGYAKVSIAFHVDRVVVPEPRKNRIALAERRQDPAYVKDYDAIPGNHPTDWPRRFDVSGWGLISASRGESRLGGAILVCGQPEVDMLEGRIDLAVIWDIRVAPQARRGGVGAALLAASEHWALSRGCREIKVETQNINVPACRFYERQGFRLGAFNPSAYPDQPDEIQLLWYKSIG